MRVCRGQQHFNGTTTIVILQFVLDIRRSTDINGISHCLQLFMLRNVAFRTIHRKRKMTNNENNFTLRVLCPFKKFPFLKSGCYDEFCNKDEMYSLVMDTYLLNQYLIYIQNQVFDSFGKSFLNKLERDSLIY